MDDRLPIGKYKDELVSTVVKDDPQYLCWMWGQDILDFDEEVAQLLEIKR
jgi:hypothetical protein